MKKLLLFILMLTFSGALNAVVIQVPGDQPTIQAGIDASLDGDTVLVAAGTYSGDGNRDLDFNSKAITVMSANGAENCVIDCGGSEEENHRGFIFQSGEDENSIVQGFTIRNGYSYYDWGGGILCDDASPSILYCVIRNCRAISDNMNGGSGGGIACLEYSSPKIFYCTIIDNHSTMSSGGIMCASKSAPQIMNCLISGNTTDYRGGGLGFANDGTLANCVIQENHARQGGAIWLYNSSVAIHNCIISENSAEVDGGGLFFQVHADPIISNCTIISNSAFRGGGIGCEVLCSIIVKDSILFDNRAAIGSEICVGDRGNPSSFAISFSDVEDEFNSVFVDEGCTLNWGNGIIDSDPLFVTGLSGNFYLLQLAAGQTEDSPCADSGSDIAGNICFDTPDGEICMSELTTRTDEITDTDIVDMGFHYIPPPASPTASPTATPSPTNTPTPTIAFGVNIEMPLYISPGDDFWVTGKIINNVSPIEALPVFFIF